MNNIEKRYALNVCASLCDKSKYFQDNDSSAYLYLLKGEDGKTYATAWNFGESETLLRFGCTKEQLVNSILSKLKGQTVYVEDDIRCILFCLMDIPVCLTVDEVSTEIAKFINTNFG